MLDIEKTRQAQKALENTRKAGKVRDAAYARQSVQLREQLEGQQTDQRELTKVLEASQRVVGSGAGSTDQLRARLSELTVACDALSAAEHAHSVEGQRLQAEARAGSDELKKQEGAIGDNRRNVGGYASAYKQGLVSIVAELVKVTAAQQGVDAASEQGQAAPAAANRAPDWGTKGCRASWHHRLRPGPGRHRAVQFAQENDEWTG